MADTIAARKAPNPWWVAVVCGMASYIDAATIVATGIALVIYQQTIGVTPTEIGIMSGSLTLCIAIGAVFGGRLGDRFGRRAVFLVTMALVAVGIAFLVFSTAFPLLLTGVILAGLGTGADLPVSLSTISEAATDRNRGALIGLSNILWSVGILVPVALSIFAGGWGRFGGQVLFAQIGVVAIAVLLCRLAIPESPFWKQAHVERTEGIRTIRADKAGVRDLLKAPYAVPFLALLVFYALTNVGANTGGQFGTYLAVNVAHIPVQLNSLIGLLSFPLGILFGVWFMKIVDGRSRMVYFVIGAVALLLGYVTPAAFGFNVVTIVLMNLFMAFGGAFAFEGIMKVWTQESFPTLLRSSAQGTIIAVARVVAALLAFVTPALVAVSAQGLYWCLAVVVAIGLLVAWFAFRRGRSNQFDHEQELDPDARTEAPASVATAAPASVATEAPASVATAAPARDTTAAPTA
jgi:inositol transporter-like SP family MFS transporter